MLKTNAAMPIDRCSKDKIKTILEEECCEDKSINTSKIIKTSERIDKEINK